MLCRDAAALHPVENGVGRHAQPASYGPLATEAGKDLSMRDHTQNLRISAVDVKRTLSAVGKPTMSYRKGCPSRQKGRPEGPSAAALNLKRLRGMTDLSIADMARELGMSPSGYQHYEARLKKPALPKEFARKVYAVLKERGVPEADLASLGIVQEVHDNVTRVAQEVRDLRVMIELLLRKLEITNE
jgi:transcriptional regulator with XRE-family HTH domain